MSVDSTQAKLYVANGLGFHDAGAIALRDTIIPALEETGVHVVEPFSDPVLQEQLSPLRAQLESMESVSLRRRVHRDIRRLIGERNVAHIVGCDAMLFIMDGGHAADDGGSWEAGFLTGLDHAKPPQDRRPVFHWRSDVRLGESPVSGVNHMFHEGAQISGGRIIEGPGTLSEVTKVIRGWHEDWLRARKISSDHT